MGIQFETALHDVLATAVAVVVVGFALGILAQRIGRVRTGLALAAPVLGAFVLRSLAVIGTSATGAGGTLRGGDELLWLSNAESASERGILSSTSLELMVTEAHSWIMSIGIRLSGGQIDPALRIVQVGIAVAGIALIAAAVYDLAGPRAGLIAAWVLALEPSSIFFSSILHKEPLLMLAGGMVALGGARIWRRGELVGLLPMIAGCLVAVATRPYAGWFLIGAGALIAFHGSLRNARSRATTIPLAAVLAAAIIAAVPVVWEASEEDELPARLQASQAANAADADANLALEQVDFSTREAIIINLPQRIRDVLLRPYPWQVGNLSQQLGVIGGLVTLTVLLLLARYIWLSRGQLMTRAGPLLYLGTATLIAYSLSAGNAGTAFRYRAHVLLFMIAALVVLREHVLAERRATSEAERPTQPGIGVPTGAGRGRPGLPGAR